MVDDAIVVIENVQRHISLEHCDPHKATSDAMGEVTSAVIATSLVLISVFVPVSFFPGTTGILYKQFALTIAFAIAISAFNALTLSPALAALFLRGEEEKYKMLDWTRIKPLSRAYAAFCARHRGRDCMDGAVPMHASFMSRCAFGMCCCWSSSRDLLRQPMYTSTSLPASFRRKIRTIFRSAFCRRHRAHL